MAQPFDLVDLKSVSINLLAATSVAAIFVLAYILSRIRPETRRNARARLRPAASFAENHGASGAAEAVRHRQEDAVAAEETQFCEAMQSVDPDDLVKQGRKYTLPPPPQRACLVAHARQVCHG